MKEDLTGPCQLTTRSTKRGVSTYDSRSGWERRHISELSTFRTELLRANK